MAASDTLAGFQASVDARDSASVLRVIAALRAARSSLLSENKMLFITCAGGTCPNDISALLEEWDYQQIAKIPASNTLCFAQAREVAGPVDGSVGRAAQFLGQSTAYLRVRNVALDVLGVRPKSLRGRKLNKLLERPDKFLEDSSHAVLSGPGLRLLRAIRPVSVSREASVHDLPENTVLVCLAGGGEASLKLLIACSRSLSLRTEIVVVLSGKQVDETFDILGALQCTRARVYVIYQASAGEMLAYGTARAYGRNLVVWFAKARCEHADIEEAFSSLLERDHFYDESRGLIGAARGVWHDLLAGKRHDRDLQAGIDALAEHVGSTAEGFALVGGVESVSDYFRYSCFPPARPFTEPTDTNSTITCFERKLLWPPTQGTSQAPMISVVMTVFDAEETVGAAMESVLRQTYENIELIVVDDCSADNSMRVVQSKALGDARVRVLQTKQNRGTYYAKNVGLRFARGALVTFHDADDVSSLNRLDLQASALAADPEAIGNCTYYQRLSPDGQEVWLDGETSLRQGYITLMLRRDDVISAVGYFDSVRVAADAEYIDRIELATKRPVRLVPVVSYFARQAEGSLTTAGVAAFRVNAEGVATMAPIRKLYREAARCWHENIYDGKSSAVLPFPLLKRPFHAPQAILPTRASR
jgi:hypothetical protein